MFSPRKNRGVGLMDVMLGLLIAAILAVGIGAWIARGNVTQRASIAATQALAVREGALSFQKANQATILAATGPTTAYTRTLAQLQAANALGAAFNGINPYGQTYVVSWIQPTAGNLQPVILTTGGSVIKDGELGDIADAISSQGGEGAYISSSAPTQITCDQGTCNPIPLASYGFGALGGHYAIAMFKGVQTSSDDFLHRHNDGNASHGQMSQAIDMQGNNLNNVGVATFATGNAINIAGSYIYGDSANLALRAASGNVYIQTAAGGVGSIVSVGNITGSGNFNAANLSAANAITAGGSITAAGNVTANGAVYASNWLRSQGATGWYSETYGGGMYMSDTSYVRVYGDKNFYTGGQVQAGSIQSNSTITAAGRIQGNEYILPVGGANIGWGCSPNGLLGRDAAGSQVVQCKDGVWTTLGGWTQFMNVDGPVAFGFNNSIATCPAGWTAMNAGFQMASNPYATAPGMGQAYIANASQTVANTTDTRVGVIARATCAK